VQLKTYDGVEQAVIVAELPVHGRRLQAYRGGHRPHGHSVEAALL
jgi:hypothetical protein